MQILNVCGFGRELSFNDDGIVVPDDGNGLDILPVDSDQEIQDAARARYLVGRRAYEKYSATELSLSPQEWEQVADTTDCDDTDAETDNIGDAIFTCEGEERAMDKLDYLGLAVETVETHPLVKEFGFAPDSLITDVGGERPVAMGFDVLAITLAGARAAKELGKVEACKVLGWKKEPPKAVKGFGADRLFRHAGALQARVRELRTPRFTPRPAAPTQTTDRKVGGIRARSNIVRTPAAPVVSQAKPIPALPTQKPEGSDWLGRVLTAKGLAYVCTCGCGVPVLEAVAVVPPFEAMRERLEGRRVLAEDLWRQAFAPRCIRAWGHGFSLVETQRRAFKAQEERAQFKAQQHPRFAPRPPAPGQPGSGIGSPGKTAREKAKKRSGGNGLTNR